MASRTENSMMNVTTSLICQVVTMLCNFVVRIVFIRTLGSDYLGINGLFSSVLSILAISELGIGSAIVFSLYKPLADHNEKKILSLMQLYKKTYIAIGSFIFCVGLALVPFLDKLINLENTLPVNYTICYLLFLSNSAIPYLFFAYRNSIISASQRTYVIKKYEIFFNLGSAILQLLCLLLFPSFYLYIAIPIITSILQNCVTASKAVKLYPILKDREKVPLEKAEKKKIVKNIYAMSITRLSTTIYASCDNIVISVLLGTSIVGLNSNYVMITGMVTTFVNLIFNSFVASVGQLNASESPEKKHQVFQKIQLITFWIYGFSSVCLLHLMNPFISLVFGVKYAFPQPVVIAIVLTLLIQGLTRTVLVFKDACGLFWETRYRALASAVVNLIASIVLVKLIGVAGAYLGTIVCILTTTFLVDPRIVYRNIFHKNALPYYHWYFSSLLKISGTYMLVYLISKAIPVTGLGGFIGQCILCLIVPNIVFVLLNRRSEEFAYIKDMVVTLIHRLENKYGSKTIE